MYTGKHVTDYFCFSSHYSRTWCDTDHVLEQRDPVNIERGIIRSKKYAFFVYGNFFQIGFEIRSLGSNF